VVHTGGVDIEISGTSFVWVSCSSFSNLVTDGGEAKALIADGAVRVDGETETRRGRQLGIGSRIEIDLPEGRQELRVVHGEPDSGDHSAVRDRLSVKGLPCPLALTSYPRPAVRQRW